MRIKKLMLVTFLQTVLKVS